MQNVDKDWLKAKLKERGRGSQKELADHLRLDPTMVSKILKGTREIQSRELPAILDFFGDTEDLTPQLQELRKLQGQLDPDRVQELLAYAQFLRQKQESEQSAAVESETQD